jgi:YfiH family protein
MEPFIRTGQPEGPELFYLRKWRERFPEITAGFSSRNGGVSTGVFSSLNCGLHVADSPEDVVANRDKIANTVGIPLQAWTYGEQIHGSTVAVVSSADSGKGTRQRNDALQNTDAFITRESGMGLAALFADCVPLFFYDPVRKVSGLAHAGWKGTVAGIAGKTVDAMMRQFGTDPGDLIAAIGPSIGPCCYEVDRAVTRQFDDLSDKLGLVNGEDSKTSFYQEKSGGKAMLDLQQANRQIMIKAGIPASSIEISKLCTSCRTDLFFSHRKEFGKTGRMIAWIGIAAHWRRLEESIDFECSAAHTDR